MWFCAIVRWCVPWKRATLPLLDSKTWYSCQQSTLWQIYNAYGNAQALLCTDMNFKSKGFYAEPRKSRIAFRSGRGRGHAISRSLAFVFSCISVQRPQKRLERWKGKISSCSCLTALPGTASVLLSKIYKPFRALCTSKNFQILILHEVVMSCFWVSDFDEKLWHILMEWCSHWVTIERSGGRGFQSCIENCHSKVTQHFDGSRVHG